MFGDWKPTVVVELSEDGPVWIAECKELDYMGCGKTVEEVKHNFTEGLQMTILMHRTLRQPHSCKVCRGRWVMPKFDWRFVEGEPA